jgi:hypothetical protein
VVFAEAYDSQSSARRQRGAAAALNNGRRTTMEIGTRVRLTQDVDNYLTCLIRAGETGTLTRITDEGTYWGAHQRGRSLDV